MRPATLLKRNTFIIWRGGEVADFELKLEYRVSAEGNSGINDRLSEVPDVKWVNAADPIGPRAIIEGDHKRVIREKKGENSIKLFNLKADPDEKSNLIDQQPELTRKLQNDLRHWQDSMLKSD